MSRLSDGLAEAQRDFERKSMLVDRQFIAQSEADRARALVNTSTELLKSAQAQVAVADAQVPCTRGPARRVTWRKRVLICNARASPPVSGIVIKRSIERMTVAASFTGARAVCDCAKPARHAGGGQY